MIVYTVRYLLSVYGNGTGTLWARKTLGSLQLALAASCLTFALVGILIVASTSTALLLGLHQQCPAQTARPIGWTLLESFPPRSFRK